MGKIKQGILGNVSGKVGSVIGFKRYGNNCLRVVPASVTDAKTDLQLLQREKFRLSLETLRPLSTVLRTGFRNEAKNCSPFQAAMSYCLRYAVYVDTAQTVRINYDRLRVSNGTLTDVYDVSTTLAGNTFTMSWTDNSGIGSAHADDAVMLVCYDPVKASVIYAGESVKRNSETASLTVPEFFKGDEVHLYISLVSADNRIVSNSTHLGAYTVA